MSIESYLAEKEHNSKIQHIIDNPEQYCEFAQKHPELYLARVKSYTLLDEKGNLVEAYKYNEEKDTYKNVTEIELAKIAVAKAEADYHRELIKQLEEKKKLKKENNA